MAHLRKAAELSPKFPETHLYLAYGLERQGLIDEAERELLTTIRLRPNYVPGYRSLGEFYERRGDWPRALSAYRRHQELDPQPGIQEKISASFLFNLAFAHQQLGHREMAILYYEELLQIDPAHLQGGFNLGYSYLDGDSTEEWTRSADLFKTVLEHDSLNYSAALYHLATAMQNLGRTDEARLYDRLFLQLGTDQELLRKAQARLAGEGTER